MNKKKSREITGVVVSRSSRNTVVVAIDRIWQHPIYKKAVRRTKKISVESSGMELAPGDKVRVVSTRPISKTKHHKVVAHL